jgi:hypothetical protein
MDIRNRNSRDKEGLGRQQRMILWRDLPYLLASSWACSHALERSSRRRVLLRPYTCDALGAHQHLPAALVTVVTWVGFT